MRSVASTTSYLELLRLASPEAIVVISALVVLTIGLISGRATVVAGVLPTKPPTEAPGIRLRRTSTAAGAHWLRASGLSLQWPRC